MNMTQIQTWLSEYICRVMQLKEWQVDLDQEFTSFGMDSATAVGLSVDLGDWLGLELDPTLVYDHPTIEALSRHLAERLQPAAGQAPTVSA